MNLDGEVSSTIRAAEMDSPSLVSQYFAQGTQAQCSTAAEQPQGLIRKEQLMMEILVVYQ